VTNFSLNCGALNSLFPSVDEAIYPSILWLIRAKLELWAISKGGDSLCFIGTKVRNLPSMVYDLWGLFDRTDSFIWLGWTAPIINSNSKKECSLNYVVVKKQIIINRSNYQQTLSEMGFKRTAQGNNGQQVWEVWTGMFTLWELWILTAALKVCYSSQLFVYLDAEHTHTHTQRDAFLCIYRLK